MMNWTQDGGEATLSPGSRSTQNTLCALWELIARPTEYCPLVNSPCIVLKALHSLEKENHYNQIKYVCSCCYYQIGIIDKRYTPMLIWRSWYLGDWEPLADHRPSMTLWNSFPFSLNGYPSLCGKKMTLVVPRSQAGMVAVSPMPQGLPLFLRGLPPLQAQRTLPFYGQPPGKGRSRRNVYLKQLTFTRQFHKTFFCPSELFDWKESLQLNGKCVFQKSDIRLLEFYIMTPHCGKYLRHMAKTVQSFGLNSG